MSVKYLYYTEDTTTGGALSAAYAIPGLDQILYMYGGERMCIHAADADYGPSAPEVFATLKDAQAAYPAHTWIYLDQSATPFLDGLTPPPDDVVYVVGHDMTGYGGESLNGDSYRLRVVPLNFNGHAIICLSVAAVDRWARLLP